MKNYDISKNYAVLSITDSLGSQLKFRKGNDWYKYNNVGNEGLAEQVASDILSCSNLGTNEYVTYEYCEINGKKGCRSKDFLENGEVFITFQQLYFNTVGRELSNDVFELPVEERFDFIVDFIQTTTGVDCSKYLFDNIALDLITKNPDRHFRNLGMILRQDATFRLAPIFDNGQGCMQNHNITPPYLTPEEKEAKIYSCTISGSFERQFVEAQNHCDEPCFKLDYDTLLPLLKEKYTDDPEVREWILNSLDQYKGLFCDKEKTVEGPKEDIDDLEYADDDELEL